MGYPYGQQPAHPFYGAAAGYPGASVHHLPPQQPARPSPPKPDPVQKYCQYPLPGKTILFYIFFSEFLSGVVCKLGLHRISGNRVDIQFAGYPAKKNSFKLKTNKLRQNI